jgi:hypothetical protein
MMAQAARERWPAAGVASCEEGRLMGKSEAEREQAMRQLAAQLLFEVAKRGRRFTLCREADLPTAIRGDNLTLEEAEDLLQTWKLRGFHGG